MQNLKTDIKARSYTFSINLISFIDVLKKQDWVVQTLARQLLRSGTSIGANIIEAQAGSSRKDFTNFFSHALKSANETKFWLTLLKDSGKSDPKPTDALAKEAQELANMLGSSIITLRNKS